MGMETIFFTEQEILIISNMAADCQNRLDNCEIHAAITCEIGSSPEPEAVDKAIEILENIRRKADTAAFECSVRRSQYERRQ